MTFTDHRQWWQMIKSFHRWLQKFSSGSHFMSQPSFNMSESDWTSCHFLEINCGKCRFLGLCPSLWNWCRFPRHMMWRISPQLLHRCDCDVLSNFFSPDWLIPKLPPPVRADHTWPWIETSERGKKKEWTKRGHELLLHFVSTSFTI